MAPAQFSPCPPRRMDSQYRSPAISVLVIIMFTSSSLLLCPLSILITCTCPSQRHAEYIYESWRPCYLCPLLIKLGLEDIRKAFHSFSMVPFLSTMAICSSYYRGSVLFIQLYRDNANLHGTMRLRIAGSRMTGFLQSFPV